MAREVVPILFDEGVLRQLCDLDVSSALCFSPPAFAVGENRRTFTADRG